MSRGRVWPRVGPLVFLLALGLGSFSLAAQALPAASTALPTEAPAGMALLFRGPDKALGLPFFSPNAIPVLRGSYLLGTDELRVWFTREPLVFGDAWAVDSSWMIKAGGRALTMKAAEGLLDLALPAAGWTVIFELPSAEPAVRRFVAAFVDRFTFFLDNAHSDAELSFPATVTY